MIVNTVFVLILYTFCGLCDGKTPDPWTHLRPASCHCKQAFIYQQECQREVQDVSNFHRHMAVVRKKNLDRTDSDAATVAHYTQYALPANATAADDLKLYITDDIIDLVVNQTNVYANQYIASHPIKPH